ncbi:uncharacterized protein LKV04_013300 [Tautogolabrus adspersus]
MMQLYGALVLFVTLSIACGLKCHICQPGNPVCPAVDCPPGTDRCFTNNLLGVVTKGCIFKDGCITPITCCEGDECNSATPSGSGILPPVSNLLPIGSIFGSGVAPTCSLVLILLMSTAIITLVF